MCRYSQETADAFPLSEWDYVIDAIDSVTDKLLLIQQAKGADIPIISCMGTGNKLDPSGFRVSDIQQTDGCPLARVMRRELRKRGIQGVRVVWSPEPPRKPAFQPEDASPRPPGGARHPELRAWSGGAFVRGRGHTAHYKNVRGSLKKN